MKKLIALRTDIMVFMAHKMGLPYFKLTRKMNKFPFQVAELQELPEGSLGKSLYCFLNKNGLDLLPYYEKHDLKHVLLNYGATAQDEVALQCFMLGNGHRSIPVLLCVIYGLVTMPLDYAYFVQSYRRGKSGMPIQHIAWFELLNEPLLELREKYGILA